MDIKYSNTEIDAIEQKMINPSAVVICPRCGKELSYRAVGNSCEVKCASPDCLKGTSRGI